MTDENEHGYGDRAGEFLRIPRGQYDATLYVVLGFIVVDVDMANGHVPRARYDPLHGYVTRRFVDIANDTVPLTIAASHGGVPRAAVGTTDPHVLEIIVVEIDIPNGDEPCAWRVITDGDIPCPRCLVTDRNVPCAATVPTHGDVLRASRAVHVGSATPVRCRGRPV